MPTILVMIFMLCLSLFGLVLICNLAIKLHFGGKIRFRFVSFIVVRCMSLHTKLMTYMKRRQRIRSKYRTYENQPLIWSHQQKVDVIGVVKNVDHLDSGVLFIIKLDLPEDKSKKKRGHYSKYAKARKRQQVLYSIWN